MRLINTETLELRDFIGEKCAMRYAILSHTWGDEEVSYADFAKPESRQLEGWKKIDNCCRVANAGGYPYVWIDTCCIDKSSSAELSEAINSMYDWYHHSDMCYVYLSDVRNRESEEQWLEDFKNSRWFTRGWTLQELLAPAYMYFYDRDWNFLKQKDDLTSDIYAITNIDEHNLMIDPRDASIAQRMCWASRRKTTREEDEAYCLLGLFDINMPLLYGERSNAFTRLQEEIIRKDDDESIFAWFHRRNPPLKRTGMLAPSPSNFRYSKDIVQSFRAPYSQRAPYTLTNKGLQFDIRRLSSDGHDLLTQDQKPDGFNYFAPICCSVKGDMNKLIILYFNKYGEGSAGNRIITRMSSGTAYNQSYMVPHLPTIEVSERKFAGEDVVNKTFFVKVRGA